MIRRGRDPRTWPAASVTGDVAPRRFGAASGLIRSETRDAWVPDSCAHRWWEGPLSWLIVGLAFAIALIPIAFVGWVVVEACT